MKSFQERGADVLKISSFKEMIEDMNNGVYDLTNNGECTGCGSCCSNLLVLTDKEIKEIRRYIKTHNIKECKYGVAIPLAQPILDMCCPFLDDRKPNHKCTIYEFRPKVCRDFICCPSERPAVSIEYAMSANVVNVRETFFGK
jgi:hypothetical protein